MDNPENKLLVVCSSCKGQTSLAFGEPATFACQKCSGTFGVVNTENENKKEGVFELFCGGCKRGFSIQRMTRTYLACPYCGNRVVIAVKEVIFSKITRVEDKESECEEEVIRDTKELHLDKRKIITKKFDSKIKMKVVIPYYSGNELVDRAIKTWIVPEVVFAITDEHTIPPGWGVCYQFFTQKNSKSEKIHSSKTKPFIIDLLKKLIKMFPEEDYYGFFNSDNILPPGASIRYLVPVGGKKIVFHHRLDLFGDSDYKTHVAQLYKGNQVCVGKDGFIADKETVKTIISEVPDMIVGAPCWDDGLLLWCWKKFGTEAVELRYGDIWHVNHPIEWKFEECDSVFNQETLATIGIPNPMRFSVNWQDISMKTPLVNIERKILGIVQPGRVGDIIIVLPIAKWYYDRGFKVFWPICSEYLPLFDYVNYVEPIDIGDNISKSYYEAIGSLREKKVDNILDLGIGFGREEGDWIDSGLRFNEWKYKEAKVPFSERFNLNITRDFFREMTLWEYLKNMNNLDGIGFNLIHDEDVKGHFRFNEKGIRIKKVPTYTVFDWIGIMEKANHLYCVDSCFTNLADQLKICVGKRTVWFWQDIPDPNPKRKPLGFPKLCDDWKVI